VFRRNALARDLIVGATGADEGRLDGSPLIPLMTACGVEPPLSMTLDRMLRDD